MNAHEGAEIARNQRLAERIAAGRSAGSLDEVMTTIRQMAAAYLDVPGPRAAQLADEIDRLRKIEAQARTVVDLGEPIAYGGAMWELRELLGPPS